MYFFIAIDPPNDDPARMVRAAGTVTLAILVHGSEEASGGSSHA
jgi:hypothetical protein